MSIDSTSTAPHARADGCHAHQRARDRPRRGVARRGGLAFAVLVAVTWGTWGDLAHDTGYDFVAAQRIADGQLPTRTSRTSTARSASRCWRARSIT